MIEKILEKVTSKNWKTGDNTGKGSDSFQTKVLKAACQFFVIFFICGLISRGMYGALLPRVSVDYGSRMYLNNKVEAEGKVVENKREAILAEEGIRIEAILVENGQSVKKDEPLIQLSLKDLEDLIESKEIEIEKYRIQIQAMEKNEAMEKEEKAVSQKRANEDYNIAKKKGDTSIAKAEGQLNEAKEERNQFPSKAEYIKAGIEQDKEYQSLLTALEEKKKQLKEKQDVEKEKLRLEIEEARTALSTYKEGLKETLSQEWETKKEQLNETIDNLEEESRQAVTQRDDEMLLATRAVEDANKETTSDSSLELAKLEKRELEKQLNIYKKIQEEEGKILAPTEGDIVEIRAVEGDRTQDSALLYMTDRDKGYRFTAQIGKKDKKHINLGTLVELTIGSDDRIFSDIAIEAIEEDKEQEEVYHVSCPVTKEMGKLGDLGKMVLNIESEDKRFCVPLSAIHSDGNQNYILLAVANKTILGEELKVVKKNVIILDKNEKYAAIDEGVITEEDTIIVSSTKQIQEGDSIRLLEH